MPCYLSMNAIVGIIILVCSRCDHEISAGFYTQKANDGYEPMLDFSEQSKGYE